MKAYKLAMAICIFLSSVACTAFAADQVAKDEITPPTAEGALDANAIPPVNGAPSTTTPTTQPQPAQQTPTPAMTTPLDANKTDSTNLNSTQPAMQPPQQQ